MENIKKLAKSIFLAKPSVKAEENTKPDYASELKYLTEQLEILEEKFNLTTDSEIIEALIYQQNSLNAKRSYILRAAKENANG